MGKGSGKPCLTHNSFALVERQCARDLARDGSPCNEELGGRKKNMALMLTIFSCIGSRQAGFCEVDGRSVGSFYKGHINGIDSSRTVQCWYHRSLQALCTLHRRRCSQAFEGAVADHSYRFLGMGCARPHLTWYQNSCCIPSCDLPSCCICSSNINFYRYRSVQMIPLGTMIQKPLLRQV